jgi:hypothetical protein
MFPNVRLLIAAVVASVVALSCGFAMFAAFRVNHEPLSRLASGAAPLQLAAGNLPPPAASPGPAGSFGNRFPASDGDTTGASAPAPPPQPERDDSVEPPSAVASTTATAPATNAAEPALPAPVAQAPAAEPEPPAPVAQTPAAEPDAKPDEVAVAPSEPSPAAAPSEPAPAATETAATEPPVQPTAAAESAAPTEQASQEPDTKPETAATAAAEPPAPEAHHKAAHRHRLAAAKAQHARQARAVAPTVSQPAGIGGPFVPPPTRLVARPQRPRQARAIVQPVSQPPAIGGPFVPPTTH